MGERGERSVCLCDKLLVVCDNCARSFYSDCKSHSYEYICDFLCCSLVEISIILITFLNEKIAVELI